MTNQDNTSFLKLLLNMQSVCESAGDKVFNKKILSIKFKILFSIYCSKKVSPSMLVRELGIAKSNIALFCKSLIKDSFLISTQDKFDKRVIYYELTKKGEREVESCINTLNLKLKSLGSESDIEKSYKAMNYLIKILGNNIGE